MGLIFDKILLVLGIVIVSLCTIFFIIRGDPQRWDAEICINLILVEHCMIFYVFMIIWIIGIALIFIGFSLIKRNEKEKEKI